MMKKVEGKRIIYVMDEDEEYGSNMEKILKKMMIGVGKVEEEVNIE